jgi:hypothetical protein
MVLMAVMQDATCPYNTLELERFIQESRLATPIQGLVTLSLTIRPSQTITATLPKDRRLPTCQRVFETVSESRVFHEVNRDGAMAA